MKVQDPIDIVSCRFTMQNPGISAKIQEYLKHSHNMPMTRCCVHNFKDSAKAMPERYRPQWSMLPEYMEVMTVQDCWRFYDNRAE